MLMCLLPDNFCFFWLLSVFPLLSWTCKKNSFSLPVLLSEGSFILGQHHLRGVCLGLSPFWNLCFLLHNVFFSNPLAFFSCNSDDSGCALSNKLTGSRSLGYSCWFQCCCRGLRGLPLQTKLKLRPPVARVCVLVATGTGHLTWGSLIWWSIVMSQR